MSESFTSDVVIGLEIHVELNTRTKLFCGCSRIPLRENEPPNSRTCPTCLGMPGAKPVVNKAAIEQGIKLALALHCSIAPTLIFSRKSYFYPDLSKNYQTSQFEIPLGSNGHIRLPSGKTVGIVRAHLEEDPASLVHKGAYSLVDYNRSGDPLCEIVTGPDMNSPEEARELMKELITVLHYLGVFDASTCIIKADANISIKESGYVRSEVKNITGFKEIERALCYEVERQRDAVKRGEQLVQDTRAWDAVKGVTTRMRTKETEADYGYIIDPDLVPITLSEEFVNSIKDSMPELHFEKVKKFVEEHSIPEEDARILAQELSLAHLFEEVAQRIDPKLAVRWLRHELNKVLNESEKVWSEVEADESQIIELLELVDEKKITDISAREILAELIKRPFSPKEYVKEKGLEVVSDSSALKPLLQKLIEEHPQAVEDVKSGEPKAINFFVGKVMKETKGQASPAQVNKLLKELLDL
ncbi:Asp-tRNA(Asn)/Glu-tRNA(Gln) amidotransferase subunit GatB [Candidatus Woesearchaeota archaeon]|nr:MAG: Asp-tRNA(Asn)/Glu-tRNA(Gln) amidotransferase subunit GatB [Candidatus Woesearchaeota archaeon]